MSTPKTKKTPALARGGATAKRGAAPSSRRAAPSPKRPRARSPLPPGVLRKILDGASKLPDLRRYDTLDLSRSSEPDLRHADPEELEPLLRSPALRGMKHLIMADGAESSLAAVLAALPAGALRSIHVLTTEAYSSATDEHTLAHIAASPATAKLEELRLEHTVISNLQALTTSPLRDLEALHLIGKIEAGEHLVLGGPAPALRGLRRLTLTPDDLTEEAARRMAASADLASLEELSFPFIQGGGFDWSGDYEGEGFLNRFPAALSAIQGLPSLRILRLTSPWTELPELGDAVQRGVLAALTNRQKVSIEEKLFNADLLRLVRSLRGSDLDWSAVSLDPEDLPPPAAWVEHLHQRGACAALGAKAPAPSKVDGPALDDLAEELRSVGITNNQVLGATADLLTRWGQAALLSLLESRGAVGTKVQWCLDPAGGEELYAVLYDPARFTEQDAVSMFDVEYLCYELAPKGRPDQERVAQLIARVGIARACELYETMGVGRLSIVEVEGELVAFDPDQHTLEQIQAAQTKRSR